MPSLETAIVIQGPMFRIGVVSTFALMVSLAGCGSDDNAPFAGMWEVQVQQIFRTPISEYQSSAFAELEISGSGADIVIDDGECTFFADEVVEGQLQLQNSFCTKSGPSNLWQLEVRGTALIVGNQVTMEIAGEMKQLGADSTGTYSLVYVGNRIDSIVEEGDDQDGPGPSNGEDPVPSGS